MACVFGEKSKQENTNRKLIDTYRREKCVFGRRSKQKNTRRVFFGGKARKKHKPEANRHEPEGKVCFLEKKQAEKPIACVF